MSRAVTARRLLADALEHYQDAEVSARRGACHSAFGSLKLAGLMDGEAHGAALAGRGSLKGYETVSAAAFNAEEAFADRCVRGRS